MDGNSAAVVIPHGTSGSHPGVDCGVRAGTHCAIGRLMRDGDGGPAACIVGLSCNETQAQFKTSKQEARHGTISAIRLVKKQRNAARDLFALVLIRN